MKLFNLLLKDHGTDVLKKGIMIRARDLRDLLGGLSREQWEGFKGVVLGGRDLAPAGLREMTWFDGFHSNAGHDLIALRIDRVD